MKNYLQKLSKTIVFQLITVVILLGTVVCAVTWPTNIPFGEDIGGTFIQYLNNIKGDCPDGEVVNGFNDDFSKICVVSGGIAYIIPEEFTFFRVNNDHQDDYDMDSVDNAENYNGQSCLWKVYFKDTNSGLMNYDIIENGALLMTVDKDIDCTGDYCIKTINKCGSSYDNLEKTAYIVEEGIIDTTGAPFSSFTNSCILNGSGDDGWDNNCNGNLDEATLVSRDCFNLANPGTSVGASYTCPATAICDGFITEFASVTFGSSPEFIIYSDSSCTIPYSTTTTQEILYSQSGIIPSCGFDGLCLTDTTCQSRMPHNSAKGTGFSDWGYGACRYYEESNIYY